MPDSTFISRVVLKNYKSIAACNVPLGSLVFLVGPNGAGKSNFLDALRFVTDALRNSLDHALRDRGGIKEVRRISTGHPRHFGVRIEFRLPDVERTGAYSFDIAAETEGAHSIKNEMCVVKDPKGQSWKYAVRHGKVESNLAAPPAAFADRLYLVNVSGLPEFRPVYEALAQMGFYNLNPDRIRDLQPPDPGEVLTRDGSNVASVVAQLAARAPADKKRAEDYLARIVPGVQGVDHKALGPRLTLEFKQSIRGSQRPWTFLASNMSDGTVRALGILVALFQAVPSPKRVRLVAIEEPEVALHPAAAGVLLDALRDASGHTQVLVTSHSPELLDNPSVEADELLSVVSDLNETKVGQLDDAGREALKSHLFTAGELLKMNQLEPAPAFRNLDPDQLRLFDEQP